MDNYLFQSVGVRQKVRYCLRKYRLIPLLTVMIGVVVGCSFEPSSSNGQVVVEAANEQKLFVADDRIGSVQVFSLKSGHPAYSSTLASPYRSHVMQMQLDSRGERLWVVGDCDVSIYRVDSLRMTSRVDLSQYSFLCGGQAKLQLTAVGGELSSVQHIAGKLVVAGEEVVLMK